MDVHENLKREGPWLRDPTDYWTLTTADGKRRGALFFAVTTPLLWCIYAGMAWWMRRRYGDMFALDAWEVQYMAYMAIAVFGWIAVVVIGDAVFRYVAGVIEEKAVRNVDNARRELRVRAELKRMRDLEALERFYAQRLAPLACPEDAKVMAFPGARPKVTVDALPPSHRTFHLRFQDLKAMVCKPYAK